MQRDPLRLSRITHLGDARRQASMRLVVEGLDSEVARSGGGPGRYQRALQVDPTNPYAYLALARHYVAQGEPALAIEHLDRTYSLLSAEQDSSPRVEPHLFGLRGAALVQSGRGSEGRRDLDRARAMAPRVWGDGRLTAEELR